jgi:hypothetical protein
MITQGSSLWPLKPIPPLTATFSPIRLLTEITPLTLRHPHSNSDNPDPNQPNNGLPEEESSDGVEVNETLMIEVAVGVLVVGLMGLVVYRRRSKSKQKSSSVVSDESSSDEVRREGLVESVE